MESSGAGLSPGVAVGRNLASCRDILSISYEFSDVLAAFALNNQVTNGLFSFKYSNIVPARQSGISTKEF